MELRRPSGAINARRINHEPLEEVENTKLDGNRQMPGLQRALAHADSLLNIRSRSGLSDWDTDKEFLLMSATLNNLITHPTMRRQTVDQKLVSHRRSLSGEEATPTDDRRLLLVLDLINENVQRQFVIREMAIAVNLSPGRLAHLFKSEVGVSPQRYVNNVRLERARDLLEGGMLSVKEIAAEIGFPNVSSFCRSFKACYGATPSEYRKVHLRIDLKRILKSTASI